ncbi:hypothetical protein Plhal710r2_c082g0180551 [Plasmopara halstedii]
MKICFSFLATLAFVQGDMYDLPDFVEKCTVTGGPHGRPFDDTSKERKGTAKKEGCKAPDDNHQLAAFFGREGEEIDAIGPVWTLRNPVEVVPGQPPSGPEQKML